MRALLPGLVIALFIGVGCDSSNDEQSDADRLVGTWAVVDLRNDADPNVAGSGESVGAALFGTGSTQTGVRSFTITFSDRGTYDLLIDYRDESVEDVPITGQQFTLNEVTKSLRLFVPLSLVQPGSPGSAPFPFDYAMTSDRNLSVFFSGVFLNQLFREADSDISGLFEGSVAADFQKQ